MRLRLSQKHIPLLSTVGVCVLLYTVAAFRYSDYGFFAPQVFVNFLTDNSFLGIIAVGMTFVILSGGIDLSVGSVMALCGVVMALMMHTSPVFFTGDLRDPARLAVKLRGARDPVSSYLNEQLSPRARRLLNDYEGAGPPSAALQEALAEELGEAIRSSRLYDEQRFAGVTLRAATRKLAGRAKLQKWERFALNRLLLEDAYPDEIARRRIGGPLVPPFLAIAIVLALGTTVGFAIGCVIRYFGLAPFIVTLAGMFFARGLALILCRGSLEIDNRFYDAVSSWELPLGGAGLRLTALIFLAVVVVAVYVLSYRPFGRNVYAVGGNEEGALLMGVPVGRTKVMVYTLSGFCAALGGVVLTFYQPSGNPRAGIGTELDAIAAVVVGGTLLSGGVGHVLGTVVGVLIFGIIQTGITFEGTLSSWWTKVAIGALLLVFILLQKLFARPGLSRSRAA